MVCTSYMTVYAMLAAISVGSASAGHSVCYATWHNPAVTKEVLLKDVLEIGTYFSSFRTFETRMAGYNIIQIAGEAGVKVAAGVQMNDEHAVDAEIEAVCTGYSTNPEALEAVYVGNENLCNKDFGTVSAQVLIGYIQRVKECTHGAVPVGTVQRVSEWVGAEDAMLVANASDLIGVNIYPFFTPGDSSPIEKLQAQWDQMTSKYGAAKCRLTETGWPTKGEDNAGNHASLETAQLYFDSFLTWAQDKASSYWFMMYDTTKSYTGMEYEMNFGLFTATGEKKINIPGFTGSKTGSPVNDTGMAPGTNSPGNDPLQNPVQGTPMDGSSGAPSAPSPEPVSTLIEPQYFSADGKPLTGDANRHYDGVNPPADGSTGHPSVVESGNDHLQKPVQGTSVEGTPGAPATSTPEPVTTLIEPQYFSADGKPLTGDANRHYDGVNPPADGSTDHPSVVESGNDHLQKPVQGTSVEGTPGAPATSTPEPVTTLIEPQYFGADGKPLNGGANQGIPVPMTTPGTPAAEKSGIPEGLPQNGAGVPGHFDEEPKPVDGSVKKGITVEKNEPVVTPGTPVVVDSGKDCAM
uniref:glucan endo-1,3-beta-D-glucosidase n=1 Tax=Peronospora matthiolae TaxID=2874970 RepID=A0AAV1UZ12_9STRA